MSINQKIRVFMLLTSLLGTGLVAAVAVDQSLRRLDHGLAEHGVSLAEITAENLGPALVSGDAKAAALVIGALAKDPNVDGAIVYDGRAEVVARWGDIRTAKEHEGFQGNGYHLDHYDVMRPIFRGSEVVGHMQLKVNLHDKYIAQQRVVLSALGTVAAMILIVVLAARRLGASIISPVTELARTARRITADQDYSRRVEQRSDDETGDLVAAFNDMLEEIERSTDARIQADEANRLKSEFLANVSHELRTPLNSILGFAEVIQELESQDGNDPMASGRRVRYVENILTSGRALLDLINDLLDLAKIEAGRMEIQPEPTCVSDVCEGLVTLIKPQATKKKITVEVSVSRTMPVIETDPAKFQQIIFNFLSNAVKFTPNEGKITLKAERQRHRIEGEVVRISVRDTGPGISAEDQEMIFEKFRQVDASHTKLHTGTGLGLAICRELAKLLGGWIDVQSKEGAGAIFALNLPMQIKTEAPQALMPGSSSS